ncbi:phage tail tip protein [Vibrio quintilis]|uniref:Fibronectin type III protein n=2 Tax=Vibrio quintilis TaxID=1117707 RepID=A0A1M7Z1Y1_9VIBR|nr:hypothetical protein [Vibrio quintilis]SHO58805.1 Fibronectin type III protein [Vibrio quintilis]
MVGAIIAGVIAAGVSAYVAIESRKQAKRMQSKLKKSASGDVSKQMFKDAVAAKQIVLGHCALSGPMVFASESGEPNESGTGEWLDLVVHLAGHPCADVTHAWLDDEALTRQPSTDSGADIEFRHENGLGWVYLYLGEHDKVPPTLAGLEDWSDNMRGDGQCFAHVRLKSDTSKWAGGIPNPKFAVKGMKLFDPRTGETQWSDNPALMVRWYRTVLKSGVPIEDSYITAANVCDELVTTPEGTEKRYRCNYAFSADTAPRTALQKIRATCDGISLSVAGRHGMQVGAYYGPGTVVLSEDDVIGDVTTTPDVRRRDLINVVSAKYTDPADNWNESDMPRVVHDGYVEQDGYEVVDDLDLTAVPSAYQAQRLGMIHLLTTRDTITIELKCNLKATQLLPGTVFRFNFTENQWQNVEFMVTQWKHSVSGAVTLEASVTKPSHYEYDGDTAVVPTRAGAPSQVSREVEAVTDLKYVTLAESNTVQAVITWSHRSFGGTTYELTFYKDGEYLRREIAVEKQYRLQDGFTVGQYEVQVVAISYGRRSPVSALAFNAAAPTTPIGCEIVVSNWGLQLTPVPGGQVNFDTMYDFAVATEFPELAEDEATPAEETTDDETAEAALTTTASDATEDNTADSTEDTSETEGSEATAQTTDIDVSAHVVGRAKILSLGNLKSDTEYQIAIREVSRWGISDWYLTHAKTAFNSDDILDLIQGKIDHAALDASLDSYIKQIETRTSDLADILDTPTPNTELLYQAFQDFELKQKAQEKEIGFAYAERTLKKHADELSASAEEIVLLAAKLKDKFAEAMAYTRAAVGYCVDADGHITDETDAVLCVQAGNEWIDGPLAEYIRHLAVSLSDGSKSSVDQLAQAFIDKDGKAHARGGMTTNVDGRISGWVNTNSGDVTSLDIIAQYLRVGDYNSSGAYIPLFWLDTRRAEMVMRGRMILGDGYVVDGEDKIRALDGQDGAGFYTLTLRNGVFPTDSTAIRDFQSHFDRAPVKDDHLTYRNADGDVVSTKRFNGSSWVQPTLLIHGDLLATGTVSGDRLVANTEIKSPVINAGTGSFSGKVTAQSGSFVEQLQVGDSSSYHTVLQHVSGNSDQMFYIKNGYSAAVPFYIRKDGFFYSSGGGYLDNLTIGQNCKINGQLYAKNIIGDIVGARGYTLNAINDDSSATTQSFTVLTVSVQGNPADDLAERLLVMPSFTVSCTVSARTSLYLLTTVSTSTGQKNVYSSEQILGGESQVSGSVVIPSLSVTIPASTNLTTATLTLTAQMTSLAGNNSSRKITLQAATVPVQIFRNTSQLF